MQRVNISLDSLQPATFARLTRGGRLADTLAGVRAAQAAGLGPVKLNMVVLRGVNAAETDSLLRFALQTGELGQLFALLEQAFKLSKAEG